MTKKTFQATPEFMFEASSLIYDRWCKAYDALKAERASKPDDTPDWAEFHAERLRRGVAEEAKWKALTDEAGPLAREARS